MYVDSHQHFWKLSRGDYSWMTPDMKVLYKDFFPEDLEPLIKDKKYNPNSYCSSSGYSSRNRIYLKSSIQA